MHTHLGHLNKGHAIKVLVVCNSWDFSAFGPAKRSTTVYWGMNRKYLLYLQILLLILFAYIRLGKAKISWNIPERLEPLTVWFETIQRYGQSMTYYQRCMTYLAGIRQWMIHCCTVTPLIMKNTLPACKLKMNKDWGNVCIILVCTNQSTLIK